MSRGSFVLRATVGGIMMAHGLQKLQGAFDGPGLEGTEKVMENLGMHPAKHQARAVALAETIGGGLTAAGFLNPLGPAMIIGVHSVAVPKVHLKNGFFSSKGGYEFNLLLVASSFAVAAQGPGPFSVDGLLRKRRSGLHWGVLATAVGVGAAIGAMKISDKMAPQAEAEGGANGSYGASGANSDGGATLSSTSSSSSAHPTNGGTSGSSSSGSGSSGSSSSGSSSSGSGSGSSGSSSTSSGGTSSTGTHSSGGAARTGSSGTGSSGTGSSGTGSSTDAPVILDDEA